MELTDAQDDRIAPLLPAQRGKVHVSNLPVLNTLLYGAERGCKWRGVPARFGRWHTRDTRMKRWAKTGILDRVFAHLQKEHLVRIKLEAGALDGTIMKVHPAGTGARNKPGHRQVPRGWTTKMHRVAAAARTAVTVSLFPGQAHAAPRAVRCAGAWAASESSGRC